MDEAHGVKGQVVREIINGSGGHIVWRFGVTGTIPKPIHDQYSLKISLGQCVMTITADELIKAGWLSKPTIIPVEINDKKKLKEESDTIDMFTDYDMEKSWLSRFDSRIQRISELVQMKRDMHGNTFVLVGSIDLGKKLEKLIPGSVFLYGNTKKADRNEFYKKFDTENDLIVIASRGIASTGISIDRIFNLMLVDYGKSFIAGIQSIGRRIEKRQRQIRSDSL